LELEALYRSAQAHERISGEAHLYFARSAAGKTPEVQPIGSKDMRGVHNQYVRWPATRETLKGRVIPKESGLVR
jgi:hypothetical protein